MQSTPALNETVLFELPSNLHAEELLLDALSDRVAWLRCGDEASIAVVPFAPDEHDFARLQRRVQFWLGTSGLLALRFEVDGRTYVLEAELPALACG